MSFFRKAKKAASNAPRVTDKAEQPSGEQQSRVVRQPKAAETSSSSPTGVADEACERSGSSSSSSTSGGVDATRANSATTTTPAAGGDDGAGAEQGSPSPLGRALRQCKKFSRARKPAAPPSGSS
jgi:hypothetical protein